MPTLPPAIGDVVASIDSLLGDASLKGELDKNLRALAQAALARLDMVSREEFDAQAEVLRDTRARVEELESLLERLSAEVEKSRA